MRLRRLHALPLGLVTLATLATAAPPAERLSIHRDPYTGMTVFIRNEAVQPTTPHRPDAAQTTLPVTKPEELAAPTWSNAVAAARQFLTRHAWAFGESEPEKLLVPWRAERDALGMTHIRFRQVVPVTPSQTASASSATNRMALSTNSAEPDVLPVVGGEIAVHLTPRGEVSSAGGRLAAWLQTALPLVPSERDATGLSRETAIALARALFGAENGVEGVADATVSRSVIAPGLQENTPNGSAYLTWAVGVSSGPWLNAVYYLDAQDGTLRFKGERVRQLYRKIYDCTANPASGLCWSSLVDTNGYHHGRREGESSWGPNPIYNAYDVDIAYDVLGAAHNYLAAHFGRDGANGQGGIENGSCNNPVTVTSANTYQDQFWGAGCTRASFSSSTCATIGLCHALTVPDVIAHEYAHGITYSVREMTYYGQSGALDESYSDVFGEVFEKSYLGATDWINAGQPIPGAAIPLSRNLREPTDPSGEGPDPDRFCSPYVYCGSSGDNGGVHWNSTILSHAAYLLSDGTAQQGPFNGVTVHAIGMEKMEQIMYRANVFYYSANASFYEAYWDWIQAATDLYGVGSEEVRQTTRALQAVELDQPGYCSGLPPRPPQALDVEGW